MKLKSFIGKLILEASKLGIDASELEIDHIEVGSITGINFDDIDVYIDEEFKTVSIYEAE